jgi:hypothetical protein
MPPQSTSAFLQSHAGLACSAARPSGIWNSYFKFCVERNPWDKVLSHYHMHAYRLGGALSLDQYFARGKFPINYPRYTTPSGSKNYRRSSRSL